jgi:hypothetical protein
VLDRGGDRPIDRPEQIDEGKDDFDPRRCTADQLEQIEAALQPMLEPPQQQVEKAEEDAISVEVVPSEGDDRRVRVR